MSQIITACENGQLMSSRADAFFRHHDGETTAVEEDGNVESPLGHFTLREVKVPSIVGYVREHGDPWASVKRNLEPGWYIDVRGEDGTVWAFYYGPSDATLIEESARRDYARLCRAYEEWWIMAYGEEEEPQVQTTCNESMENGSCHHSDCPNS